MMPSNLVVHPDDQGYPIQRSCHTSILGGKPKPASTCHNHYVIAMLT